MRLHPTVPALAPYVALLLTQCGGSQAPQSNGAGDAGRAPPDSQVDASEYSDAGRQSPCGVPACNGTGDDTSVLQCLLTEGGTVVLPAGRCMVKVTLVMGTSGTRLRGHGPISAVVYGPAPTGSTAGPSNPDATVLASLDPNPTYPLLSLTATNCEVSNLTVNGGATAYGGLRNASIYVAPTATNASLHDLESTASVSAGIYVQASGASVFNAYLHDNYGMGIFVGGNGPPMPYRTDGVTVSKNLVAKSHLAWYSAQSGDPGDGLDIDTMTSNATVEENTVRDNDIILAHELNTDCDANGKCYSWGHQVLGNVVENVLDNGVSVKDYVEQFTVSGNTVRSFGNNSFKANGYGIKVGGGVGVALSGGNSISGNVISGVPSLNVCPPISAANYPTDGNSKVTCGGILLWQNDTGTPAGIRIEQNQFPSGADGQYSIDVLSGAPGIQIIGNSGTVSNGVSTIDTTGLPMLPSGCGAGGAQPCPAVPGGDAVLVENND